MIKKKPAMLSSYPIRVLQVFKKMDRGGAETGIMQALRRTDPNMIKFDFIVNSREKGYFDDEIKSLNSNIYYWDSIKNPFLFYINFRKIIKKHGPFDIIHSRLHHFSGIVLLAARILKVPIRIAHSHSAINTHSNKVSLIRRIYYKLCKILINYNSTCGFAVSKKAAESLFGKKWNKKSKYKVIYTGIDLSPYKQPINKINIRKNLGISDKSTVIGHVGSFREPKNHKFLVQIFYELQKKHSDIYLILCGQGTLENDTKNLVKQKSIYDKVLFLGLRDDIPSIMMAAMDIFVLPSKYEGFPHAAIEAQAAGLPCFLSENITTEVRVVKDLVYFLPINSGEKIWTKTILSYLNSNERIHKTDAYKRIEGTQFDVNIGVKNLTKEYLQLYESTFRTRS